jgi:hypothetical protein
MGTNDGGARSHDFPVSPTFRRPLPLPLRLPVEDQEDQQHAASRSGNASQDSAPSSPQGQEQQHRLQGALAAAAVVAEPSQPHGHGQGHATEETEVFSHDEIVCLRLIFALYDDNGDDFVDEGELMRYAEETGACVWNNTTERKEGRMGLAYCPAV